MPPWTRDRPTCCASEFLSAQPPAPPSFSSFPILLPHNTHQQHHSPLFSRNQTTTRPHSDPKIPSNSSKTTPSTPDSSSLCPDRSKTSSLSVRAPSSPPPLQPHSLDKHTLARRHVYRTPVQTRHVLYIMSFRSHEQRRRPGWCASQRSKEAQPAKDDTVLISL